MTRTRRDASPDENKRKPKVDVPQRRKDSESDKPRDRRDSDDVDRSDGNVEKSQRKPESSDDRKPRKRRTNSDDDKAGNKLLVD